MRFSLPNKKQVLKGVLWFLVTILAGALANGVWQSLLGPAIHFSTRWVLDIASLGLTSYKNMVYRQIAADDQSVAAYDAYLAASTVLSIMMFLSAIFSFYVTNLLRQRTQHLLRGLSDAPPNPEPAITGDAQRQQLVSLLKSLRRLRLLVYLFSLLVGVAFVREFVSTSRVSYVTSADAHYHQVMRVVSPFLDTHEQAEIESDFAQIGSREDYVRLLSRLEGQCKAQGRTVPKFDPW